MIEYHTLYNEMMFCDQTVILIIFKGFVTTSLQDTYGIWLYKVILFALN